MKKSFMLNCIVSIMLLLGISLVAECSTIENYQLPLYCYTISNGRVNTYNGVNGSKIGWIDGAADLVIITKNVGNGWVYGSYPVRNGRKEAYFRLSDVIANVGFAGYGARTSNNMPVYNKVNKAKKFGTVYSTDNITVVSQSGNMLQIIYPINNGYKMGWIETSGSNNNNSNSNSNNSNNFAIIYEGWYRIGAKLSPGKGLDVDNAKMGDRVNVQLWTYVNVPQQKFYIKHIGNGWHTIRAGHSGKALDVNISAGYNVEQYSYDAGDAQLWRFVKNGDGTYCIHSKLGKALDCYNAGTDDGNNICVWDFHGGDAQRWILSKVSQSSSSNSTSSSSSSYTNKLKSLINQYNEKKWTGSYYGAVQCKGFASMIFNQLFGTGYIGSGSVSSNKTNYILNNLNSNVRKVGTLYNYSVNQLADLMSQARPGDFLQVRRTNGGPHSMIVVSVNSDSVNIFDCNSRGDLVVHYYTQSFSTFRSKNIGVSLYTAKSY